MSHYYRMPPASPVAQDPYAGVVHSTPSSSAVAARRLPSLTMDLDSTPKPMSSRTQYNSPRTVALSTRPLDVAACSAPMDARARSTSSQGTSSKNSSVDLERVPARPKRKRITPEQLEVLLSLFAETDTPSYELRETVGAQLKMSNREVQVWFQNRRAKERTARQKHQPVAAPSSSSSSYRNESDWSTSASSRSPTMYPVSVSSPTRPYPTVLPPGFSTGRRRSVSASAVDMPRPQPMLDSLDPFRMPQRPPSVDTADGGGFGPMRPRLTRFHSHATTGRRDAVWHNIHTAFSGEEGRTLRTRASSTVLNEHAGQTKHVGAVRSLSSSPTEQCAPYHALPAPFPSQRFMQASPPKWYRATTESDSTMTHQNVDSLADRRNTRLPPIKMLFDVADSAAAFHDLSPTSMTLSSVSSSNPSLASPFAHLNLRSPNQHPKMEQEQDVGGYFDERITGHAGGVHTPSFGGYVFGRDFQKP